MTHVLACSESVESCEKWANSTTQQVDLAFNVFFMIYFFIRVVTHTPPPPHTHTLLVVTVRPLVRYSYC